jgi:hypothetical protein
MAAVNSTQHPSFAITCVAVRIYFTSNMKVITVQTVILICNILISFFGTLANSLVIMAYYRNPHLRTIENTIFLLLAITDISVTALGQPAYVTAGFRVLLGKRDCLVWDIAILSSSLFLGLSLLTITILSLQSYITLAYPYRFQMIITKRRLKIIVILSWLLISMLTLVAATFKFVPLANYVYIGVVTTTFCAVIFTWSWTYKLVSRHRRVIESTQTPSSNEFVKGRKILRSTITAFVVTSSLLGCHFLGLLYALINRWHVDPNFHMILFNTSATLMYSNSLLNPCLLFWRNSNFRIEARSIFEKQTSPL